MHTSSFDALAEKAMQLLGLVNRPSRAVRHYPAGDRFVKPQSKTRVQANSSVRAVDESLFTLGRIALTPSARVLLDKHHVDVNILLARHQRGDWGCIDQADYEDNMDAVTTNGRILGTYQLPVENGLNFMPADEQKVLPRVLVSTNSSRLMTTVLTLEDLSGWLGLVNISCMVPG